MMIGKEKPLVWVGSSKKDLMTLSPDVRKLFGHALEFVQRNEPRSTAKLPKGSSGKTGMLEVVEDGSGGTHWAVYTVKFTEALFVLHCFQKERKTGIVTQKEDMDIIRARLKVAEALAQVLRNARPNH